MVVQIAAGRGVARATACVTLALTTALYAWQAAGERVEAQQPTLEYRVKAAYIYNFIKYVEWPPAAPRNAPLVICVAGRNPFGSSLDELVRGESVAGRPLDVRVVLEPDEGCNVVFVPQGAAAAAYLRVARPRPVLTIGETSDFIHMGGIIRFVREEGRIRFEIDQEAASRVNLRVSSRLLRLARPVETTR